MFTVRMVAVVVLTVGTACTDKAEVGYHQCERLEAEGKFQEASAACDEAASLDPESAFGKTAATKHTALESKLDEMLPATITAEWCDRLKRRLENRLIPNVRARFGEAGAMQAMTESLPNTVYSCREDIGKPTAGQWACRWNHAHDFDEYVACGE